MTSFNKQALAAALVLVAAGAVQAQSTTTYGGLSIASPHWSSNAGGVSTTGSGISGKVYGGYNFTPNYSLELGVVDLGHMRNSVGETKAWGGYVDGVGKFPVADRWSVLGRVGVAEGRFDTPVGKSSKAALKFGAGVQYDLSPTAAVVGEYEYYHFGDVLSSSTNIGQLSVGLKLGF